MLVGKPGVEVLLHLQRVGDEQTLAFDARVLAEGDWTWGSLEMEIRVVVVGSHAFQTVTLDMGTETTEATTVNGHTISAG